MFEIEQKYRIQSPSRIRNLLREWGAKKIRSGAETNELFDFQQVLRSRGSVLRLRRYGKEKKGLLTFKGPRLKGNYKKRVEIETAVKWKPVRALLKAAGFGKVADYSKTREEYAVGKSHITLDHLKKNGWFVEIEGTSAEITRLAARLGFSAKDREERTYLEILNCSL